jgi:hypothetical protein
LKITARERKFLWAGGIICGIALAAYLVLLFVPSREDLAGTVEFKKKLLQREKEAISREGFYKARVEEYKARLDRQMTRLLPGDNPSVAGAELQKILKELADQSGVEITQRNVQREQKIENSLVKVSVQIVTNCGPEELVQFLAAIENHEKTLSVDELIISSIRVQKQYEIRPSITVSGYIVASEAKPEANPAASKAS